MKDNDVAATRELMTDVGDSSPEQNTGKPPNTNIERFTAIIMCAVLQAAAHIEGQARVSSTWRLNWAHSGGSSSLVCYSGEHDISVIVVSMIYLL